MKNMTRRKFIGGSVASMGLLLATAGSINTAAAQNSEVIELTQTYCQFIESENETDHKFDAASASDCEAINDKTGVDRLAQSKTIELKPGSYTFRVTNRDVDHSLGFYLRGDGLVNKARLPKVSGGGLTKGVTKDYNITLKPGEYVYSCPLNPTIDYKLIVSG